MEHHSPQTTENALFNLRHKRLRCSISSASVTISDGRFKFCEKGRQVLQLGLVGLFRCRANHRF